MVDVVVGGATGKLGSLVCRNILSSDDLDLVGAIVSPSGGNIGREVYPDVVAVGPDSLESALKDCDVYVDLTSPSAATQNIPRVPETGANLVLGTTSVDASAMEALGRNVERYGTSALISSNFSHGVNVFWKTCEIMAGFLNGYDIEVIETHHNAKKDAPSGTAKEAVRRMEAVTGIDREVHGRNGITGPRGREIGIHSVRAGNIVGDHTVIFAKDMERMELTHKAISRESLADGCLESIRWMAGKRDGKIHNMNEVFGL